MLVVAVAVLAIAVEIRKELAEQVAGVMVRNLHHQLAPLLGLLTQAVAVVGEQQQPKVLLQTMEQQAVPV